MKIHKHIYHFDKRFIFSAKKKKNMNEMNRGQKQKHDPNGNCSGIAIVGTITDGKQSM